MRSPHPLSLTLVTDRAEDWLKRLVIRILVFFLPRSDHLPIRKDLIKDILVVRQHDQLGDMLCVIPLLRALRTEFGGASITLVASPVNEEIMKHHPYVDHLLTFRKSPSSMWSFIRNLRSKKYDLALVPATVSISQTSNLIALLSGAPIRIGPRSLSGRENPASALFTNAVDLDWEDEQRRHQTLRNLDIARPLDLSTRDLTTMIGLTDAEVTEAETFLRGLRSKSTLLVGMHPGAGKEDNRWPAERFAAIANRLSSEHGATIVITAGPMDDVAISVLRRHLRVPALFVERHPIRFVAAVIDQLDLFISNDTGVMHVAAATRAQTLSLFGPTDPLQWAPVGQKNSYVSARSGHIDDLSIEEVYQMIALTLPKPGASHRID